MVYSSSQQSLQIVIRQCVLYKEEVFGPVVTVEGFETEQEAIQLNDSIYGLAGAVFSKDIEKHNALLTS